MECFDLIRKDFYEKTGIRFDSKIDIVDNKIKNFYTSRGYRNCAQFRNALSTDENLFQSLIDHLTVSLSFFYRELEHFEFIQHHLTHTQNAIFSLPCATGEEPYSLAIFLLEHKKYHFHIDGADISKSAIEEAKRGCYLQTKFRYMPKGLIEKYFTQRNNRFCIDKRIKKYVHFFLKNIFDLKKHSKKYDFVMCRNLFIYFDVKRKQAALENLYAVLKDGGYLIIGKTDNIDDIIVRMKKIEYKNLKIFQKEVQ